MCYNMKSLLQNEADIWSGKLLVQKRSFCPKTSLAKQKNNRHPQKAILQRATYIVLKFQVPTAKGGWYMVWQSFKFKNAVFCPKTSHPNQKNNRHPQKALLQRVTHIVLKFQVPTPKGSRDMLWQSLIKVCLFCVYFAVYFVKFSPPRMRRIITL